MLNRNSLVFVILLSLTLLSLSCSNASVVERGAPAAATYVYRPPEPVPTPVNPKANQYAVTLLDGGSARLADLIGNNKVVLVNFWATWCGPCRLEIPDLIALQRDFKDEGFEVVGLTVENPMADRERVQTFMQRLSINYKVGFSPEEMFSYFNGVGAPGVIPQTFIFDRNGKLVDSTRGFRRNFRAWAEGAVKHALKN